MVPASDLKTGTILHIEKSLYKVLATKYHMGGGKMGGLAHVKLKEVRTGLLLDRKFKPKFTKVGDIVKADVNKKKYIERTKR